MNRPQITYTKYTNIPAEAIKNGTMTTSAGETDLLVNNALANFAHSGRVQAGAIFNYPHEDTADTTDDMIIDVVDGKSVMVFQFNPRGMVTGATKTIKACVYLLTDTTSNDLEMTLQYGRNQKTVTGIDSLTFAWQTVTLSINENENPNLDNNNFLQLFLTANGGDFEATIRSISVFELPVDTNPAYVDLSGANSKAALADYPYSAALVKILDDNNKANRHQRARKSNLLQHCMKYSKTALTTSYDADYRGLGCWRIVKAQGVTSIDARVRYYAQSIPINQDVQFNLLLYTTAGVLVANTEWVATTNPVTIQDWYNVNFSGLSSATTEYEIRFDARENAGTETIDTAECLNMFVYETLATRTGDDDRNSLLPAKKDVQPNDDLIVRPLNAIKELQIQTWNRNRQILINDWYIYSGRNVSGDNYWVLADPVGFFSYGSKHIICRAKFSKPSLKNRLAIPYDDPHGGDFDVGDSAIGANGAHGVVVYDDAAANILYLKEVNGTFHNDELITATGGEDVTVNGTPEHPQITTKVKFVVAVGDAIASYADTSQMHYHEVDVTKFGADTFFEVVFNVPIPSTYWNVHEYGTTNYALHCFILTQPSSGVVPAENDVDFVYLHELHIYEEVQHPLEDFEQ